MKKMRRVLMLLGVGVAGIVVAALVSLNVIEKSSAALVCDDANALRHERVGLILGCAPRLGNGAANPFFSNRIAAAVELFKAGKVDFLLASGDNRKAGYDEPTAMRDALVASGVPAERITLDYAGFSTLDSVVRAKRVFGLPGFCVITQRDHAMRALYIARENGIDAVGFAAADVPASRGGLRVKIRESLARMRTLVDVHVLDREPHFLGPAVAVGESGG